MHAHLHWFCGPRCEHVCCWCWPCVHTCVLLVSLAGGGTLGRAAGSAVQRHDGALLDMLYTAGATRLEVVDVLDPTTNFPAGLLGSPATVSPACAAADGQLTGRSCSTFSGPSGRCSHCTITLEAHQRCGRAQVERAATGCAT